MSIFLKNRPLLEGHNVQRTEQEVVKGVSICKIVDKHESLPIHLKTGFLTTALGRHFNARNLSTYTQKTGYHLRIFAVFVNQILHPRLEWSINWEIWTRVDW